MDTGEAPAILFCCRDRAAYGWLSNFERCSLRDTRGRLWPTVEHAYQASKFAGQPELVEQIRLAPLPRDAKRLGRHGALRPNWNALRDEVMRRLVLAKFTQNPDLAAKLLATGDAELVEDAPWDRYLILTHNPGVWCGCARLQGGSGLTGGGAR